MEFHMYKHKMFFYGVTLYTLKLRTKRVSHYTLFLCENA